MLDFNAWPTPAYIIDEAKLIENLSFLKSIEERTGCSILLAQKCFSCYSLYPLIGSYLAGTAASGLYEARLAHEEMGRENHVFAPAYKKKDMAELVKIADHIVFNSLAQYHEHYEACKNAGVSMGLRINPECSTQSHAIYDPCAAFSRLGIRRDVLPDKLPDGVEGLHFHTLCEQNADALIKTFKAVEAKFGSYFPALKWLNLGGGHYITHADYDVKALEELLLYIKNKYKLKVYLEPGEAVVLNAGYLASEVLDIVHNGMDILILDISAACHMPDVLEMPYLPPLHGAYPAGEKPYTYRLSSVTCLAGDVIGDYSFAGPVKVGDKLFFEDMALYTMVKNNTFNGMPLPDIWILRRDERRELLHRFGYADFKGRLA